MLKVSVLLFLFGFPLTSHACSCREDTGPIELLVAKGVADADVVFVGKVMDVKRLPEEPGFATSETDETTFVVSESYKGNVGRVFKTTVSTACCICGYVFEKGVEYLVYAEKYGEGMYTVSSCGRTKPLKEATKELVVLRKKDS